MEIEENQLSCALVKYLGYGTEPYPKEDESRLVTLFGNELSTRLRRPIQQILGDLDQLKPDWNKYSMESVGTWVKDEMRLRYPSLDGHALNALAWVFMWWWR